MSIIRCVLALAAAFGLAAQTDRVKIWQDSVTLPTYREGKPPVVPPFDQFGLNGYGNYSVYPYTLRTNLTTEKSDVAWRTLNLENRYLHCRIMPDWGGHVYSCKDKLSGTEMLYSNSAMKKTDTGPRGAWIAGGIETSFPIAHSRLSVSPVQFATRANEDGSATVIVGAVDRVSGMEWQVAYTLYPDRAYLEQKVRLYNRGRARQPFQWWTNAALRLPDSGYRLTYPMWVTLPHGAGNVNSWPINVAGTDMRNTLNYPEAQGVFGYGSREPFFAAYNPESKTGVAHWADPKEVPGKKAWVWGVHENYRERFSDDHSGYIEIQAGLLPSQEQMEFLEPQHTRAFTEIWIPSRDTAGITRVTPDAVLYLDREKKADGRHVLRIDLNVTRRIPGATITVTNGDRTLYREKADLDPGAAFHGETPAVEEGVKYRVELHEAGRALLAHVEDTYDAVKPSEVSLLARDPHPEEKRPGVAAALFKGEQEELVRTLDKAAATYRGAMAAFPKLAGPRKAAGRLAVNLGRFAEAAELLAAAHGADAADSETAYYLGIARSELGDDEAAKVLWRSVAAESEFGNAAQFELACAMARAGDRKAAAELLHVLAGRQVGRAGGLEAALLRRAGESGAAQAARDRALQVDPMDSLVRFEATLAGSDDAALWERLAADPEWVLDVADDYFQVGLYEDAVALLGRIYPHVPELQTEPGSVAPQDHPLVAYYRGYARLQAGQSAAEDFRKAAEMSTLYVYPYRASSGPVLRAALAQNSEDATAHYLLGCWLYQRRMTDEAMAEWKAAKPAARRMPGYDEAVARALVLKGDLKQAAVVVREAIAANPQDTELKERLMKVLPAADGKPAAGSTAAPVRAFATSQEGANFVLNELALGHVDQALRVFTAVNFPNEKERPEVRQAYIEAQVRRVVELARLGRCELVPQGIESLGGQVDALPFTFGSFNSITKQPRIQFYLGLAQFVCGQRKDAAARLQKVAKATAPVTSSDFAFSLVAAAFFADANQDRAIEVALEKVRSAAGKVDRSLLLYSEGMLLRALGRREEAARRFAEGAATGPVFSRYLNAVAQFDPAFPR